MRTTHEKLARSVLPPIIAAGCVLCVVLSVGAITELTHPTPHVGDIVAFNDLRTAPASGDSRLIVHRQDRFGCVLDLNVLRRSGGSLIVEGQSGAGQIFRVHWAGARTTDDAASCGAQADLIVESGDLDSLALAAGGYGADSKHTPFAANQFGY